MSEYCYFQASKFDMYEGKSTVLRSWESEGDTGGRLSYTPDIDISTFVMIFDGTLIMMPLMMPQA